MTARTPEFRAEALGVLMPGFAGTELPEWVDGLLRDGLGGLCLFAHNVDTPKQVAELCDAIHAANPGAIIAIDEEGGEVSRLHQRDGSPFPGNAILGRLDDVDATRAVARAVGVELASVGIDMTLAPDADVNCDPDNPVIGVRSFGADPAAVARHTAAWTEGVQSAGVAACAKHFPGHGDTDADSHVSVPVVTADRATLDERELEPFRAAISAGSTAVMTSHLLVPALDPDAIATFSPVILGDLLRGELGFDGVVVTDALDMVGASGDRGIPSAAVTAVAAGADLLCLGKDGSERNVGEVVDALTAACASGALSSDRLSDAARRVRALSSRSTGASPSRTDPGAGRDSAVTAREVAASFSLSDRARSLLAARFDTLRWVRIEPEANVAIGSTPFGPFYDGGVVPDLEVPIDDRSIAARLVSEPGTLTVVVGREFHRDAGAYDAAADIASTGPTLVVDMGVACADIVDVATFGASRLVGEALLELVGEAVVGASA